MLKKSIFPLLFLLVLPVGFAEITITIPEKQNYNLGEALQASISVKEADNYNGFFKLEILCEHNDIQYYVVPLSVEKDIRIEVPTPTIRIPEGAKGICKLRADFEKGTGHVISAAFSKQFHVSDSVTIDLSNPNQVKPGDTIIVAADVVKKNGEIMDSGTARIRFNDYEGTASFENGKITHTIDVGYVAAGFYALKIIVSDEHGNKGEMVTQMEIIGIPKRIETELSKANVVPNDFIHLTPILYDQTDQKLNQTVHVVIENTAKDVFFTQNIQSGASVDFPVNNEMKPGQYKIKSSHGSIEEFSSFTVLIYSMISMKQEGSKVIVENVGNVPFKDEVSIVLRDGKNDVIVKRKINLKVSEESVIDLSKYVEGGTYDIILPEQYSRENSVSDVEVADNRNALRKGASGLVGITGASVRTTKDIVSSPLFAFVVVFFILIAVVLFYGKSVFRGLSRKRKKHSGTHNIFKDYKFK